MPTFADRTAARWALAGPLGEATNRFFRGATSKSEAFQVTDLSNGHHRLEFFTPARNPGYGKRYIQEINGNGQIVREFKETFGPQGLVATKWIHGGPEG